MKTLREKYLAALLARGESVVNETSRRIKVTRSANGYYYLGKSGSLRVGATYATSVPVPEKLKVYLLMEMS